MRNADFALLPGELALVLLSAGDFDNPLSDAAEGLIEPAEGSVKFLGSNWSTLPGSKIASLRAKIGRFFSSHAWLSNLNVDENVYLAQRYHTNRPFDEIAAEALALALHFGLNEIPSSRPSKVRPIDLQRAACVRAFLGEPQLLLLESPSAGAPEILPALAKSVATARARGAAVLWLTTEPSLWADSALEPTAKFKMMGLCLNPSNSAT